MSTAIRRGDEPAVIAAGIRPEIAYRVSGPDLSAPACGDVSH